MMRTLRVRWEMRTLRVRWEMRTLRERWEIAEDFGPVRTTLASRSPTESIAGPTVEGARARTGPCVHGAKNPARASRAKRGRARPAQSAIGTSSNETSVRPECTCETSAGV